MMRSLYGVAALALLTTAVGAHEPRQKGKDDPGKQPDAGWKADWGKFVAELAPYLKRGAPVSEVKEKFEGQQVVWEAEVREVSLKAEANSVKLKMPAQTVTLSNGAKTEIDYLHVAPGKDNAKKWEAVKAGDKVRFRTTLKGDSLFPVVSVLQGIGENAGKDRVIISTHDGELVEVLRPKKE